MLHDPICFVDLETTGTNARYNRVIEIGILKVKNNKVVKKYKQLVNPETRIDPFIERLTGITQRDVENAPTFQQIKEDVLEILKDSIFVAHNVRFDYGFLRNEFKRHEINFKSRHFCTVKLARLLYPGKRKYNLDSLISDFNIKCKSRHRAYDDAKVLWEFYKIAQKDIEGEKFTQALNIALKRPSIPISISQETLDNLPETTGVYVFYGDNGLPLYIGKSVNIKDRVLSHFSSDHLSSTDMKISQQVKSIQTIETAGELGALLLESTLIKKEQPLFNQQLRNARKMTILVKTATKEGYNTVEIKQLDAISVEEIPSILGVFRSLRELKDFLYESAKDHKLCPKILKLEKGKGHCFYYHLNQCNGACRNEESVLKYNLRFDEAFYKRKIRPWSFEKPIVIRETGEKEEHFVIDKWCYLGSIKNDFERLDDLNKEYVFDYDTYKILSRFIYNPKNLRKITILGSLS